MILIPLSNSQTFGVLKELCKEEKQTEIGVLKPCYVIPHSDVFLSNERQINRTQIYEYEVAFYR